MAFIPIDAKADLQGQKKGKITPAQHAILNAWCLASKTGILDFPQDHTVKGRCETDTLNITNIQQNETEIIFNKGYLVVCGRLVECEDGTKFTFKTPITGKETGRIIARFSLGASGNEEFKIMQKTGALIQNDLNDNPVNGEYELELYSYEAEPTVVTLKRTHPYVPDIGGKLAQFEASLKDEGKPLHGYNDSKGTIEYRLVDAETRLTALGFKEGTVSLFVDGAVPNTDSKCAKMGCWIIVKIVGFGGGYINTENAKKVGTITGIDLLEDITLKEWTATQQYLNNTSWKIVLKKNGDLIVSKTNSGNINTFTVPYIYQAFTENVNYQPPTNII